MAKTWQETVMSREERIIAGVGILSDDERCQNAVRRQAEATWKARDSEIQKLQEKFEGFLRLHTREGDCPCPEHQQWVKDTAKLLVAIGKEAGYKRRRQ